MRSTPPRTRKSPDERRAEIEAAAAEIALAEGLSAVTLRAVAGHIGVASGLVAHYAPSMEDLVASTFTGVVGAELDEVDALLAARADAAGRLGVLIDTLLDGSRDDVTRVWVQAWALGSRSEALAAAVRASMDRWQALIAGTITAGGSAFELGGEEPDAIAWQILAMIDGLTAHSLVRWRDAPDRRALTKRSVAALIGVAPAALGA